MDKIFGLLKTPMEQIGEKMDILESKEVIMLVV